MRSLLFSSIELMFPRSLNNTCHHETLPSVVSGTFMMANYHPDDMLDFEEGRLRDFDVKETEASCDQPSLPSPLKDIPSGND